MGGRAFTTREIVNYPGYKASSGPDLTNDMAEHAKSFGVEVKKEEVKSVDFSGDIKIVILEANFAIYIPSSIAWSPLPTTTTS